MINRRIRQALRTQKHRLHRLESTVTRLRKKTAQTLARNPTLRDRWNLPRDTVSFFDDYVVAHPASWRLVEEGFKKQIDPPNAFNEEANRWYYDRYSRVERDPAGVAVLEKGRVYGHNGGQYVTADSAYLWDLGRENWRYFEAFWLNQQLRLPHPTKLEGVVAVIADEYAYRNFSHWVFDVLPKFYLIEKTIGLDSVDRFLVGHAQLPFQIETLARLGVPMEKVTTFSADSCFTTDTLLFPRLAGYNRNYHPSWAIDWLMQRFDQSDVQPIAKIFVSRAKDRFRYLSDEAPIQDGLKPFGFQTVTLNGVSLDDTIRMFSGCRSLVGCFGSGLMNVAFCPRESECFEIAGTKFYNPYHWYLSEERGIRHHVFFGDDRRFPSGGPIMDVEADVQVGGAEFLEFFRTHSQFARQDA